MKVFARARLRRGLLILGAVLAVSIALLVCLPLLFAPGQVAHADVILHLANDARMQGDAFVARLFREGFSQHVVCASSQASWDLYPADSSRAHLIELGLPTDAVSVLHLPITDCGGELVPFLIEGLRARGAKSVLIVSDPTVTRYSEWRLRQRMSTAGITVATTFAAEDRRDMLDGWWRSHWKAQRIVGTVMNSTIDLLYAPCR